MLKAGRVQHLCVLYSGAKTAAGRKQQMLLSGFFVGIGLCKNRKYLQL